MFVLKTIVSTETCKEKAYTDTHTQNTQNPSIYNREYLMNVIPYGIYTGMFFYKNEKKIYLHLFLFFKKTLINFSQNAADI